MKSSDWHNRKLWTHSICEVCEANQVKWRWVDCCVLGTGWMSWCRYNRRRCGPQNGHALEHCVSVISNSIHVIQVLLILCTFFLQMCTFVRFSFLLVSFRVVSDSSFYSFYVTFCVFNTYSFGLCVLPCFTELTSLMTCCGKLAQLNYLSLNWDSNLGHPKLKSSAVIVWTRHLSLWICLFSCCIHCM